MNSWSLTAMKTNIELTAGYGGTLTADEASPLGIAEHGVERVNKRPFSWPGSAKNAERPSDQ